MINASIAITQRYFHDTLGTERIRELHRANIWYDVGLLLALPTVFVVLLVALSRLHFGAVWCACLVIQGFVLMAFGLAAHEQMHRRMLPGAMGRVAGLALFVPLYRSPTQFAFWHGRHHTHLGTAHDSEQFKTDIDCTWRRIVYATVLGVLFPQRAFRRRPDSRPRVYPDTRHLSSVLLFEARLMRAFTVTWIGAAWFFPGEVLLGYVLPLVLVTPFASTLRTVIEHSEFDASNPFQLGCFYRTNPLTRVLFLCDSGDCHFVHHVFPRMPFYRIPAALLLMRPYFLSHGVKEHRSLAVLVWRWFADSRPYLSPASTAGRRG